MSKAFVIKNKEGKYYQRCYNQSPFTDDLFDANKYQYKEEAEKILNNSFTLVDTLEVVEITIAEGDLEQENKQLKEQLEEIRKSQKITFETLLITDKALELATNYCQKEIDGDGIGMQDIQAIYEIGTEFFINKAKESMK